MTKRTPPYSPDSASGRFGWFSITGASTHRGEYISQYVAIRSIAAKIGCSGETLRNWVRQAERDQSLRAGPTSQEQEGIQVSQLADDNAVQNTGRRRHAHGYDSAGGRVQTLHFLSDSRVGLQRDRRSAMCAR